MCTRRSPYTRRRYFAAATGGATMEMRWEETSSGSSPSVRATSGQLHITATGSGCEPSARMNSAAISSSPHVAGTARSYPAARHACQSWIGNAGCAAINASAPTMMTATGFIDPVLSVNMDTPPSRRLSGYRISLFLNLIPRSSAGHRRQPCSVLYRLPGDPADRSRKRKQCPDPLENDESPSSVDDGDPRQERRAEEVQGVVGAVLAGEPSALQSEVS